MILQALVGYYERKVDEEDSPLPAISYSVGKIDYCLVINKDGELVGEPQSVQIEVEDNKGKKKLVSRPMVVPQAVKRTSGVSSNFMWDKTDYVLGADKIDEKLSDEEKKKKIERIAETFQAFVELHHKIGDEIEDEGMKALLKFLDSWKPENVERWNNWKNIAGSNLVFRLDGELKYLHQKEAIRKAWIKRCQSRETDYEAICLVTGDVAPIERIHPSLKGVRGAQSSGANIIGFQEAKTAFCSYGKDGEQGLNSPVSEESAFKYTTALNYLLSRDSGQSVQIGDATTVFWAGENSKAESWFGQAVDPGTEIEEHLKNFLSAIRDGRLPDELKDEKDKQFFILGLSPNAGRISVRFWYPSTVEDVFGKLGEHYARLKIEKQYDKDFDFPGLWWLLKETATLGKSENIQPLLSGELMRSILTGSRYPESLLSAVLSRIRADGHTNYNRASLTKAILIKNHNKEVTVSLNKENKEIPYLLGRLFAVLERAQEDAAGGQLNATIKDKYFGSASATPRAVFPLLLSLSSHHTKKGEHGGYYEKMTAEIMEDLPDDRFSASMPLEDQGLFFVGYYHQNNDFYKTKCEHCGHRFSSWEAKEKIDEKASKKDHRIVACPKCGASVEVNAKKEKKSDKPETTETN